MDPSKKRLLILCYDFPPYLSVGARRPAYWAKYLPQFGVKPIVFTRKWVPNSAGSKEVVYVPDVGEDEVVREDGFELHKIVQEDTLFLKLMRLERYPGLLIRKAVTLVSLLLSWQSWFHDHYYYIFRSARKYLLQNEVDAIIATGEPWLLFKHARALSREFGIPWIADYRDGWSADHSGAMQRSVAHRAISRYLTGIERRIVNSASLFTTVAEDILQKTATVVGQDGVVLENGVDYDLFGGPSPQRPRSFEIIYTGHLYPNHDVERFLTGYELFLISNPDAEVRARFIGVGLRECVHESALYSFAERFPQRISIEAPLDHSKVIEIQKSAALLLKFNLAPQSKGYFGAKLYEYAASKRMVLTVPTYRDDQPSLLLPDRNFQSVANSSHEVARILENAWNQYREGSNMLSDVSNDDIYSISNQKRIADLADILKLIVKTARSSSRNF